MSDIKEFHVRIRGLRPLVVHNGQLADPLNPICREMSKLTSLPPKVRKQQGDSYHEKLGRLEFEGSIYFGLGGEPVIPYENIVRMIRDGATFARAGKTVEAGIDIAEEEVPLEYDGPKDAEGLWEAQDERGYVYRFRKGARVGGGVVQRTRCRFPKWAIGFTVRILPDAGVSPDLVKEAIEHAGRLKGMCDWRGRYGLFALERWEAAKVKRAA